MQFWAIAIGQKHNFLNKLSNDDRNDIFAGTIDEWNQSNVIWHGTVKAYIIWHTDTKLYYFYKVYYDHSHYLHTNIHHHAGFKQESDISWSEIIMSIKEENKGPCKAKSLGSVKLAGSYDEDSFWGGWFCGKGYSFIVIVKIGGQS